MNKATKIILLSAMSAISLVTSFAVILLFSATNYPVTLYLFGFESLGAVFRWLAIGIIWIPIPAIIVGTMLAYFKKFKAGLIITIIPAVYAIIMLGLLFIFRFFNFLTHSNI